MMLSKPIALENSAIKKFNADVAKGSVTISSLTKNAEIVKALGKDTLFTADALQKATQINTLATHEMLSKMVEQETLQLGTLRSMFTGRHYTEITLLYNLMNGSMDNFIQTIGKGANYLRDFDKQMFNINNQMKEFKNQSFQTMNDSITGMSESLAGLLMIINETKGAGTLVANLLKLGTVLTSFVAIVKVLSVVGTKIASMGGMGSIFGFGMLAANPVVAGITAVGFAIGVLLNQYRKLRIEVEDRIDMGFNIAKAINQSDITTQTLEAEIKTIKQLNSQRFEDDGLNKMNVSLLNIFSSSADVLENFKKLKQAQEAIGSTDYDLLEKEYQNKIDTMKVLKEDLVNSREKSIDTAKSKEAYSYLRGTGLKQAEELFNFYRNPDKKLTIKNSQGIDEQVGLTRANYATYTSQKYGTSALNAQQISHLFLDLENTKEGKLQGKLISEIKKISDNLPKDALKNLQTANQAKDTFATSVNQLKTKDAKELFQETGMIIDYTQDKGGEPVLLKDKEAFTRLLTNSYIDEGAITEDDRAEFEKSFAEIITQIIKEGSIKGYQDLLSQAGTALAITFKEGKKGDGSSKIAKEYLGNVIKTGQVKYNYREQQKSQKVDMKYESFAKEDLSLEEALLKVGKSKAQQDIISYQYKLKQLEVNKELLVDEKESFSKRLKTSFGANSSLTQKLLSGDLSTVNAKAKEEFGKGNTANYQLLVDYAKVLYNIADANQNMNILPLERQAEVIKGITSTFTDYAKILETTIDLQGGSIITPLQIKSQGIVSSLAQSKTVFSKAYGMNTTGINWQNLATSEYGKLTDDQSTLRKQQADGLQVDGKLLESIEKRKAKLEDILEIMGLINDQEQNSLDLQAKKMSILGVTGNLLSQLGSSTGVDAISNLGNVFSTFQSSSKTLGESKFNFSNFAGMDFGDIFQSTDFANIMKSAGAGMQVGSTVGSLFGGQSAQSGGSLGGSAGSIIGSMSSIGGPMGMAIGSVAGSVLGKVFAGDDKTEEAAAYNKEQAKLYQDNTEALQTLSTNMSNLSSGMSSLTSSLITSLAKIPTNQKLGNATSAMSTLEKTMLDSANFGSAAYQVTHKKSGKSGFMGIGATANTYWTETVKMNVNSLMKKYGYYGKFEDWSTDQMGEFADYLDKLDMGDSDNFSILASAITDYANALNKVNDSVDTIFAQSTLEGFEGISSIAEESIRTQLEDFYTNLGIQIDTGLKAQIDELVKELSTAVSVTQDIRSNFLSSWVELGGSAGEAFQTSVQPYMEDVLNNASQIYYDVYFSGINTKMEDDFKALSEQMVELKRKGGALDWEDVTTAINDSFSDLLTSMSASTQLKDGFNDILIGLQDVALERGLDIGDMLNLGILTTVQTDLIDNFKQAILSKDDNGALTSVGNYLGDLVGKALSDKIIESVYSDSILQFSDKLDNVLAGNLQFSSVAGLLNNATSLGVELEQERLKMEAITSLFDFDKDINYSNQESDITYSSGVSQSVVNNYNLSASVNAGNVIESDSIEALVESTLDSIIEKLKIDKGIDITKNY